MALPPLPPEDQPIAIERERSPAMIRTLLLLAAVVTLMMTTAPGGILGPAVATAPQATATASRPA
ncbi:hypothetical protein BKE38_03835 [Pseudoroseomonas deserti]|uniref:Uncharacterized protein n=1 Tax=Teichococcus deserti TaxID=1817963 RepID=A0A1V2H6M1_9PROT|nr:hypothetical protein BKE38_03835 [Pseudoroseomonas deserti]